MTDEELNEAIEYNLRHLEHDYSIEEELEETMKCLKETQQELQRKDNIINGIKQEIERLLEKQYASERFAKENGFNTYLPAKVNLEFLKNKINELEGDNK